MNLPKVLRGRSRVSGTIILLGAVLAVFGCYLVGLDRAAAQQAAQQQYGEGGQATPEPERLSAERVTLCHYNPGAGGRYVTITVGYQSAAYQGHRTHPNDIIPAPPGGCPTGPPEPTSPEPTSTATATADPTTPQPTPTATASAEETTGGGGCPVPPEPTTASPTAPATATSEPTSEPTSTAPATATQTATATPSGTTPEPEPTASPTANATDEPTETQTATGSPTSPGFTATPTAVATKPGEDPGGEAEVTGPDGGVSTIALYDLDVNDPPPLPGGPGGIARSEVLGQKAAARALLAGDDFHGAVAAAQPYLNACDSRDAVRLAAVQLGIPMPETGGPAALSLIAATLLMGSGIFAWRLGVRGQR